MRDCDVIGILAASPVFAGIDAERIAPLLDELCAQRRTYADGDFVRRQGEKLDKYPIVLQGAVEANLPQGGKPQIVGRFGPGESFAEAVPTTLKVCPVEIRAIGETHLLFIPAASLLSTRNIDGIVVRANVMAEMSNKIADLSLKLTLLAEPSLRRRILMYLRQLDADDEGVVTLRFNRRELASYLGVNEKSLLRELKRMASDGVLDVRGKRIRVRASGEKDARAERASDGRTYDEALAPWRGAEDEQTPDQEDHR